MHKKIYGQRRGGGKIAQSKQRNPCKLVEEGIKDMKKDKQQYESDFARPVMADTGRAFCPGQSQNKIRPKRFQARQSLRFFRSESANFCESKRGATPFGSMYGKFNPQIANLLHQLRDFYPSSAFFNSFLWHTGNGFNRKTWLIQSIFSENMILYGTPF